MQHFYTYLLLPGNASFRFDLTIGILNVHHGKSLDYRFTKGIIVKANLNSFSLN